MSTPIYEKHLFVFAPRTLLFLPFYLPSLSLSLSVHTVAYKVYLVLCSFSFSFSVGC